MVKYSKSLADRFIKDYSLPISNINEENFNFQLDFFQDMHNSRTKWEYMCKVIDDEFDGNIDAFLTSCKDDVDRAVDKIKGSEGFERFNTEKEFCDFKQITGIPTKFNPETGKTYMSVDLVKANFQALNSYDPEIFGGCHDYTRWLDELDVNSHTSKSKRFREVVFGMCNPSRQITMEKSIVWHINEFISSKYSQFFTLISANSDELIYEMVEPFDAGKAGEIAFYAKQKTGYSTRCQFFTVTKHHLETESGHKRNGFYVKHYATGNTEVKCLERQYAMIAKCLLDGIDNNSIPEPCFHFNADGLDAIINEKFILVDED